MKIDLWTARAKDKIYLDEWTASGLGGRQRYGRGKRDSFHFLGKSPTDLAEIIASAMEQLKEH